MAKVVRLQWTPIQREIAAKVAEGSALEDLVAAGYTRSLAFKVLTAIKNGQSPPEVTEPRTEEPKAENQKPAQSKTSGVSGKSIEVGKITITPENWGMSQYGAVLILDTYNKSKRDINYGGTIGEFLCDVTKFYRRIVNYEEVEYVGPASEGGDGHSKNGETGIEESSAPVLAR